MSNLVFALFAVSMLTALVLSVRSSRRLSVRGRERKRARALRLGPWFGQRADFTPEGWRQRLACYGCMLLALIALLYWGVL